MKRCGEISIKLRARDLLDKNKIMCDEKTAMRERLLRTNNYKHEGSTRSTFVIAIERSTLQRKTTV